MIVRDTTTGNILESTVEKVIESWQKLPDRYVELFEASPDTEIKGDTNVRRE